jgi:hypothetical protein
MQVETAAPYPRTTDWAKLTRMKSVGGSRVSCGIEVVGMLKRLVVMRRRMMTGLTKPLMTTLTRMSIKPVQPVSAMMTAEKDQTVPQLSTHALDDRHSYAAALIVEVKRGVSSVGYKMTRCVKMRFGAWDVWT